MIEALRFIKHKFGLMKTQTQRNEFQIYSKTDDERKRNDVASNRMAEEEGIHKLTIEANMVTMSSKKSRENDKI